MQLNLVRHIGVATARRCRRWLSWNPIGDDFRLNDELASSAIKRACKNAAQKRDRLSRKVRREEEEDRWATAKGRKKGERCNGPASKNNDRLPCRILRRAPFLRAARAPCVLTTLTDERTMHNECYGYPGVVVNIVPPGWPNTRARIARTARKMYSTGVVRGDRVVFRNGRTMIDGRFEGKHDIAVDTLNCIVGVRC